MEEEIVEQENTYQENTDQENTDQENTDQENTEQENTNQENTDQENTNQENNDKPIEKSIIQSSNDNIDITNTTNDNETIETLQVESGKEKRKQFKEECNHCLKIFKSKITYDKHVTQQLCYTQEEITYCKICCINLSDRNQYKKHLFTMEHLNNIGYNKIDRLQTKEISQVHLADPYLNSNDINKIATTNLGDSFTFVFNVGNTKTVSLVNNIQDKQKNQVSNIQNTLNNSTLPILEITNNNINNDNDNDNTIQSNTSIQQIPIEPTIRQQKIISVLEKHINDKITPGDSGKMFYKFLDNKLQIEDYKSLNTIIGNLHIPNNYKETYLKVVEIFISMLVKEKSKGEKLYKDKDISEIVINLTS